MKKTGMFIPLLLIAMVIMTLRMEVDTSNIKPANICVTEEKVSFDLLLLESFHGISEYKYQMKDGTLYVTFYRNLKGDSLVRKVEIPLNQELQKIVFRSKNKEKIWWKRIQTNEPRNE